MAEIDENFDGIAESRSTVGDGESRLFSPEKRKLAKIWSEFRNLSNVEKISGIFDENVAFQRNFRWGNFGLLLDGMTEFGKKFDGETESGTPWNPLLWRTKDLEGILDQF